MAVPCDIANADLAPAGTKRIVWAANDMPVLRLVSERFKKQQPLKGVRMSCCLHVTAETANLMRTLKEGGANVMLCASNPLSTQDDVAASLVHEYGIPVYAIAGEKVDTFYKHLNAVVDQKPNITMDDGADLVNLLHTKRTEEAKGIKASMEETTTGVIRLRAMERGGALRFPVIAVNDADTKHLFDNRYGTGQSTLDGVIRATDALLAGKNLVVLGYGWCGRGVADRARGMGANVTVTEVNPLKALEAVMDGFRVCPVSEAVTYGDIFVTVTGNKHVIRGEHFEKMKDGAIVCNSGHFDVELEIPALARMAKTVNKGVRRCVDAYVMADGRRIYLLAEGRLVNLASAEGHPASVMDMSFATQALCAEWAVRQEGLTAHVYEVDRQIEDWVAKLKLQSMGVKIDQLTPEQDAYLASYAEGT